MSQPRRLRARKPAWVQTRQRKPSSFGSNVQPVPLGIESARASIPTERRVVTARSSSVIPPRRASGFEPTPRREPAPAARMTAAGAPNSSGTTPARSSPNSPSCLSDARDPAIPSIPVTRDTPPA
jgi:hypothetical protein